jgi:hypothetical protein
MFLTGWFIIGTRRWTLSLLRSIFDVHAISRVGSTSVFMRLVIMLLTFDYYYCYIIIIIIIIIITAATTTDNRRHKTHDI